MKDFLFCMAVMPVLIIGLLIVVVVFLICAVAFITWDIRYVTEELPAAFEALTWTKIRAIWLGGLVITFFWWQANND